MTEAVPESPFYQTLRKAIHTAAAVTFHVFNVQAWGMSAVTLPQFATNMALVYRLDHWREEVCFPAGADI